MTSPQVSDRLTNPASRQIFSLSWPIAMNALLLQAILIIDTALVAPLGEEALAAMGLASSMLSIVLGMLFALSNGTQILLAQAYGADNPTRMKTAFWCGLVANLLLASVALIVIVLFGESLLNQLATTSAMGQLAWQYSQVFLIVVVGTALCQNFTVFFNANGHSRIPFYSNLVELPFNALLSYALINGVYGLPELGLIGAAWGSAVAVCIRTALLGLCLRPHCQVILKAQSELATRFIQLMNEHWRYAWPVAATYVTMSLSMSICMMMYASLKVHEFAAMTILFLWMRVAGILATAWGQATGILIGQLLGRGHAGLLDDFVTRAYRLALFLAVFISCVNFVSSHAFAFIYPELKSSTQNVLAMLMPMFVVIPLVRTANVMCGNVIRAGGDAAYAFRVHVSVQALFTLPLTAVFIFYFNLSVLWIFSILLAEEIIKAIPFHRRVYGGKWKRNLSVV